MGTEIFIKADEVTSTTDTDNITGSFVTNGSTKFCLDVAVKDSVGRVHWKVHSGKAFVGSQIFTLASGANGDILIDLTAGVINTAFQASAGGDARFDLFEGATFSSNGTTLTVINNNRSSGTTTAHKFYYSPTPTGLGSTLFSDFIPGGSGTFASGGDGGGLPRGGSEWVLAASTKYMARVTNLSAQTITASVSFSFYLP